MPRSANSFEYSKRKPTQEAWVGKMLGQLIPNATGYIEIAGPANGIGHSPAGWAIEKYGNLAPNARKILIDKLPCVHKHNRPGWEKVQSELSKFIINKQPGISLGWLDGNTMAFGSEAAEDMISSAVAILTDPNSHSVALAINLMVGTSNGQHLVLPGKFLAEVKNRTKYCGKAIDVHYPCIITNTTSRTISAVVFITANVPHNRFGTPKIGAPPGMQQPHISESFFKSQLYTQYGPVWAHCPLKGRPSIDNYLPIVQAAAKLGQNPALIARKTGYKETVVRRALLDKSAYRMAEDQAVKAIEEWQES